MVIVIVNGDEVRIEVRRDEEREQKPRPRAKPPYPKPGLTPVARTERTHPDPWG